jgi:hypothetical protein
MLALMDGLTAYQVRVSCKAREIISFGPQPGSAVRGALYTALSEQFCPDTGMRHLPGHSGACPVCWLLATEDPTGERGHNLPRPLTVQPPESDLIVEAGKEWSFGISLVGERAGASLPFLVRAIQEMGKGGLGRGRGRFTFESLREENRIENTSRDLLSGGKLQNLTSPINAERVQARAEHLPGDCVTLRFLTPLRVGEGKRLLHRPDLGVIMRRLLERCQAMALHFGRPNPIAEERENWRELSLSLSEAAEACELTQNRTRWLDVQSGSRRTGTTTPIGGLVGEVTWEGHLAPLIPWLLWGSILQVGKSTVKGNGWFELLEG